MKLDHIKKCIVHDNCPDGLVSAILLRDALPDAEIQFVAYGSEAYKALRPEPGVLYADFSPPVRTVLETGNSPGGAVRTDGVGPWYVVHDDDEDLLKAYVDAGTIVLDHHATAKPIVEAFVAVGQGVFGDEKRAPGVCGASLVFDHVWVARKDFEYEWKGVNYNDAPVRDLARLAGIRDTWQRSHDRWREACAQARVLMFYPREHWMSMSLDAIVQGWDTYAAFGEVLEQKNELRVAELIEGAYAFTSKKGTKVAVVAGADTSDVAETLGSFVDLVVGFAYSTERTDGTSENLVTGEKSPLVMQLPKMRLSTRSHTTFDCAAFAKKYGGGGHTKAAGFHRKVFLFDTQEGGLSMNPYSTIEDLVEQFEGGR